MTPTLEEKRWLDTITSLGCCVCRNLSLGPTPSEVHHLRNGKGLSQRSNHMRSIPLCPYHHRSGGWGNAFHAGKQVWQHKFGLEEDLLGQVDMEVYVIRLNNV